MSNPHVWIKSTLGHGESMCSRCLITNREAAVLGVLNDCPKASDGTRLHPAVQHAPATALTKTNPYFIGVLLGLALYFGAPLLAEAIVRTLP